jgi:hypothetical protein
VDVQLPWTTATADDDLYQRALDVAHPGMDKGDLLHEAMKQPVMSEIDIDLHEALVIPTVRVEMLAFAAFSVELWRDTHV